MVDVKHETEPMLPLLRLQGFVRYALGHEAINQQSAERLQTLNEGLLLELLEPDIQQALTSQDLPSNPPTIPTLRTMADFALGQRVQLVVDKGENFYATSIIDFEDDYIRLRAAGTTSLRQLVAPTYVGLITNEEYQAYQFGRRGAGGRNGTQMSYIYANSEFSRILAELGYGCTFDFGVIQTVRRHFLVNAGEYRPLKSHLKPISSA